MATRSGADAAHAPHKIRLPSIDSPESEQPFGYCIEAAPGRSDVRQTSYRRIRRQGPLRANVGKDPDQWPGHQQAGATSHLRFAGRKICAPHEVPSQKSQVLSSRLPLTADAVIVSIKPMRSEPTTLKVAAETSSQLRSGGGGEMRLAGLR
jgi:hypothetical protein